MPVTPIYGFPYPEIADPVDPAAFCTLADLIDAQLNRFNTDLTAAKDRPYASATSVVSTTYAVNVEAQVVLSEFQDNAAMFNPGTPDRFTITRTGIYMVNVWEADVNNYATLTGTRFAVYQGGVLRYGEAKIRNNGSTSNITCFGGLLRCDLIGETIDCRVIWQGTGGPGQLFGLIMALRYVAPIV